MSGGINSVVSVVLVAGGKEGWKVGRKGVVRVRSVGEEYCFVV
jgi:hypothetical protein